MRLLKLLILGAAAGLVYKRFFAGPGPGYEETAAAQPFSSESLGDDGGAAAADSTADADAAGAEDAQGSTADGESRPDPLTQPTWLAPSDAS